MCLWSYHILIILIVWCNPLPAFFMNAIAETPPRHQWKLWVFSHLDPRPARWGRSLSVKTWRLKRLNNGWFSQEGDLYNQKTKMGWLNQKKKCNLTMKMWEWTIINTGFAKQNVAIQAAELGIKPSRIVCLSRQKCQETKHGEFHQQPWNKWFNIQQESFVYGLFLKWHHGNHGSIYSRTMKRCEFLTINLVASPGIEWTWGTL